MSIDVGGKVSSNLTLADVAWTEVRIGETRQHTRSRSGAPSNRDAGRPRAPIHWPRATISGTAPCAAFVWV